MFRFFLNFISIHGCRQNLGAGCNMAEVAAGGGSSSSSDASMSSEVDDVLSNLCKNMLLLNQEQQQSRNGQMDRFRNNTDDLLMVANAMNAARNGANCLLSIGSVSDPGPVHRVNYIGGAAQFSQQQREPTSNHSSNGGELCEAAAVNVDWSLFDTSATTTPRDASRGDVHGESHSKSAPNLHNCSLSHACNVFCSNVTLF